MKALVYHGPGKRSLDTVDDPTIKLGTDVILEMETTTICGSDLHILKGDVAAVKPGTVLGHEGIGKIVEVGKDVKSHSVGDRVIVSPMSSCGVCRFCRANNNGHCLGDSEGPGGWRLGGLINGVQAQFARIPLADNSLHKLPSGLDPKVGILVSDVLPTGHEVGAQAGQVTLGSVVAVIGCGPVGLGAIVTSLLYSPSKVIAVDADSNRLELARKLGATDTVRVNRERPLDAIEGVKKLTEGGFGVDVAMEAVGVPVTFSMALGIAAPGGRVANIGVHGAPVDFPLQDLWDKNIAVTLGIVSTHTIPLLLAALSEGKIDASQFVTHEFDLSDLERAYDVFSAAAQHNVVKVAIRA